MKYCFILGKNKGLSIAEISAFFGLDKRKSDNTPILIEDVFIVDLKEEIEAKDVIRRMGGIIKIVAMEGESGMDTKSLIKTICPLFNPGEGKFHFGFSFYGLNKPFNSRQLGMESKKYLKNLGKSCRWVISRDQALSSVVVEQNKLLRSGVEIVLVKNGSKFLIGKTLAVQPFKELSQRDYGRPARDDLSGMIPPKLAQIMINLSGVSKDDVLLDPFCGSGTILSEAMLMGCKKLIGSDISLKAVKDAEENINWVKDKFNIKDFDLKLFDKGAEELSGFVKTESIDAIVTEPYLGPQRGWHDVKKTINELENLYSLSLKEFYKVLKSHGRVVMIWPVFRPPHRENNVKQIKNIKSFLNPELHGFKIVNLIPEKLIREKGVELTERNTIIYGREGQKVFREIVVLEK